MLHFVLGRSGYGKSEYLRRRFAELASAGEDKLLFLVPDQITFETEAAFLNLLGPALSRRVLVLGFSRLCDYVFERSGHRFSTFADEGVRHLVMSLALEQVSGELRIFERRASAMDMCEVMLSAVKEYKKCSITPDTLRETAAAVEDDTLSRKLSDTAIVYDAYNAIMERSYMDPLDTLSRVADILDTADIFDGYTVALDSFYGFTAQEYDVIERLMCMSREMYVALTDDNLADSRLFFVPRRTRARLSRMARSAGIAVAPYITMDTPYRYNSEALIALEENLYRVTKEPYEESSDDITIYAASGIYDECDYVARTIRKLIEDGYRYRDIAVIARSVDKYTGVLDTYFDKYNISYFMDEPQNIDAMPIVRLVSAAFDIAVRGFDRDDVLTLLKTGLCSYSVSDIAEFENYLFVWDISGRGFFDEFTSDPGGFSDEMSPAAMEQLRRIEALRTDIIGKLRRFARAVRDADGRSIARALMQLLYDLGCDDNINALCGELERGGEESLAADLIRMWNILCEILDKTVAVLGDYRIPPTRFGELLYINFANSEFSSIPRGLDQVDIATADRALINDRKIVFVIGAVDGEFPHTPVEAGVFTDDERCKLKDSFSLPLSDSIEELIATEHYYVYSALTSARDRLYVSYPCSTLKGEAITPSDMLTELCVCVPGLKRMSYELVPVSERLYSERSAFDYLIRRYHSTSSDIAALRDYFSRAEGYRDILEAVEASRTHGPRRMEDPSLARALFGEEMRLSSTRIDTYHKCAFRYFCEYGLRARERRRAAIDPLEYGTLIHYIFESFFSRHGRAEYAAMDEAFISADVSAILDAYIDRHFGGTADKSPRFLYLFYRIKSTATRLVVHIVEELRQSDFTPVDFELKVGEDIPSYTLPLSDGLSLCVRGSVDRVDLCERDGLRYIRVVDYKTGSKDFRISDILYGLNLQMFIYMCAIREGGADRYGDGITPAGVLYMPSVSPSVNADSLTTDKIREKVLREYTMKGVILDDADVIASMEHDGKGVYIPVKLADGTVTSGADNLATLEQMGAIFRRIDTLISQMAQALYDGDVDARPLKGDHDGCEYCCYNAVCLRGDDGPERACTRLSAEEVYATLMREEDDNDERVD